MRLPLLQTVYLQESDPRTTMIFFSIVGIAVIVIIIANLIRRGVTPPSGRHAVSYSGSRRFSRWAFMKSAAAYGLSRDETSLLEAIFRKAEVANPETTLANPGLLDKHFKKAFRDIDIHAESEPEAEAEKALLFSIRTSIEAVQTASSKFQSSRNLPKAFPVTCSSAHGENYPSRVVSAKEDHLKLELPRNAIGTALRFSRGTKLTITFYSKSSQGYTFETKVVGTESDPTVGSLLVVLHSDAIQALPSRRNRRKNVQLACFFYHVTIEQRVVGRKVEKKTVVDERRAMGTIMDISAGGCSIKTTGPIKSGEYIKVEFSDSRAVKMAALGRIVRTNRASGIGGIMHIQFLKAPRRTLNTIQSIVYGYDQD